MQLRLVSEVLGGFPQLAQGLDLAANPARFGRHLSSVPFHALRKVKIASSRRFRHFGHQWLASPSGGLSQPLLVFWGRAPHRAALASALGSQ